VLLHFFKDDAHHLDQRGLGRVLVHWIRTGNMDVVERAHHLQERAFVDLSSLSCHKGKKRSNDLQLDLLIAFGCTLTHLVYDGID
jgi:hypothetical protein